MVASNYTLEDERRIMELRDEGLTYREIGEILGRPEHGIKTKHYWLTQDQGQWDGERKKNHRIGIGMVGKVGSKVLDKLQREVWKTRMVDGARQAREKTRIRVCKKAPGDDEGRV